MSRYVEPTSGAAPQPGGAAYRGPQYEATVARRRAEAALVEEEVVEAIESPEEEVDGGEAPAGEAVESAPVGDDEPQGAEAVTQEAPEASGAKPEDATEVNTVEFDPTEHTVAEVKEWVGNSKAAADLVLEAELGGKNRPTLVSWLQEV